MAVLFCMSAATATGFFTLMHITAMCLSRAAVGINMLMSIATVAINMLMSRAAVGIDILMSIATVAISTLIINHNRISGSQEI